LEGLFGGFEHNSVIARIWLGVLDFPVEYLVGDPVRESVALKAELSWRRLD
jgi:hypothetical protein